MQDSVQLISNDIIKLSHNSSEVQDKIIDEMAVSKLYYLIEFKVQIRLY